MLPLPPATDFYLHMTDETRSAIEQELSECFEAIVVSELDRERFAHWHHVDVIAGFLKVYQSLASKDERNSFDRHDAQWIRYLSGTQKPSRELEYALLHYAGTCYPELAYDLIYDIITVSAVAHKVEHAIALAKLPQAIGRKTQLRKQHFDRRELSITDAVFCHAVSAPGIVHRTWLNMLIQHPCEWWRDLEAPEVSHCMSLIIDYGQSAFGNSRQKEYFRDAAQEYDRLKAKSPIILQECAIKLKSLWDQHGVLTRFVASLLREPR